MGARTSYTGKILPPGHAPITDSVTLHPMQRMAADHLLKSQETTAPVSILGEAEADGLVHFHDELSSTLDSSKIRITLTHILVALTAATLRRHPRLNAVRVDKTLEIYGEINIGLALALPDGNLIVPVIKAADTLSLQQIAETVFDLRSRGMSGKLGLDDVRGATFTITNAGMVPCTRWTTPIIPTGQSAILGIGAARRAPVVKEEQVVAGWMLPLSLTFDHCAFNGYPASEFLEDLATGIADPQTYEISQGTYRFGSETGDRK